MGAEMKKLILFAIGLAGITACLLAGPVADPGSCGVDWDKVRQKAARHKWAGDIVERMKKEARAVMSRYEHPPLGTTGWLHEYFCDDDARRLTFDPDKPNEHVCQACGRIYSGSPYDDCWRSSVHGGISKTATQAAIVYRITGERDFFEYARKTLLWYADNYDKFAVHGAHAGKGRIREQSLDEATQLVLLAQAYWDICPDLTGEDRKTIAASAESIPPPRRYFRKNLAGSKPGPAIGPAANMINSPAFHGAQPKAENHCRPGSSRRACTGRLREGAK